MIQHSAHAFFTMTLYCTVSHQIETTVFPFIINHTFFRDHFDVFIKILLVYIDVIRAYTHYVRG